MTPPAQGAVELVATHIEWRAGAAVAEGAVVLTFGDQRLTGARATWSGDRIVIEHGVYTRADGVLAFDRAEVALRDRGATLEAVEARTGDAVLRAGRLEVAEGRWRGEDAELFPCSCADGAPAALSLKARRIDVIPGEVAIVRGGTVRVFGVPVVPVPWWRVPLDPRGFRLGFPDVRHGDDGWAGSILGHAILGQGGVGSVAMHAGPAWREDRGGRVNGAAEWRGGTLDGAIGWDAREERVRGIGVTEIGYAGTPIGRVAGRAEVPSDDAYVADYAVDYVARGVAWRESRGVWELGPQRLDAWIPDDDSAGLRLRERLRPELGSRRASAVAPRAEVALVGTADTLAPRGLLGVDARTSARAGPLWLDGGADAHGFAYLEGDAGLSGAGDVGVAVPIWSEAGALRVQWWPGARATGRLTRGEGVLPEDRDASRWGLGPALGAQTTLGETSVVLQAVAPWTEHGLDPMLDVAVRARSASLRAQVATEVQVAEIRVEPAPLSLGLGAANAEGLTLGWTDATLHPGRLLVGGGLAWDFGSDGFSGSSARIGYDDGCVSAIVSAAFAPDRAIPDLGFAMVLRR